MSTLSACGSALGQLIAPETSGVPGVAARGDVAVGEVALHRGHHQVREELEMNSEQAARQSDQGADIERWAVM